MSSLLSNLNITDVNCPNKNHQGHVILISLFSFIFNFTLLLLIYFGTPPLLKAYSKILYASVIIDLISTFVQFSTQTRPELIGEHKFFVMCIDGWFPWLVQDLEIFRGKYYNYVLLPCYTMQYLVGAFPPCTFIYRYLQINWNYMMTKWTFGLMLSIVVGLAALNSWLICYASMNSYDVNVQFLPTPNPQCTRFVPQYDQKYNEENMVVFISVSLWIIISKILEFSYFIIVICAILIYRFLAKQVQLISAQNKTIQRQISLVLGLQSLVPFSIYYFPHYVFRILYRTNINKEFTDWLLNLRFNQVFLSYMLIPMINPLFAIITISAYRRALLQFLYRGPKRITFFGDPTISVQTSNFGFHRAVR